LVLGYYCIHEHTVTYWTHLSVLCITFDEEDFTFFDSTAQSFPYLRAYPETCRIPAKSSKKRVSVDRYTICRTILLTKYLKKVMKFLVAIRVWRLRTTHSMIHYLTWGGVKSPPSEKRSEDTSDANYILQYTSSLHTKGPYRAERSTKWCTT
jgi:hypothetical protein